jgi:endonuclease/exonuclease/phosphatase (EEP) superfamily protein YafD
MQIQTRLRRLIRWLLQGGGTLLGAASLLGFLSAYRWQFDMLCHWRVQYSIVFVLLTALFVWRRRWRWTGIFAVFALINLAVLWPCLPFFRATPPVPAGAARLKILHANVFYFNHHYERLLSLIEQEKPDIIALCELTPDWVKALKAIDTAYSVHLSVLIPNHVGSATGIWSKIPEITLTPEFLGSSLRPTLLAKTDIGGAPVTFLVAHTTAPFGKATILAREEQLYAIADRIAEIGPRVVLIGDLNTTPWSFGYRETIRKSGLRDAAREGGVLLS